MHASLGDPKLLQGRGIGKRETNPGDHQDLFSASPPPRRLAETRLMTQTEKHPQKHTTTEAEHTNTKHKRTKHNNNQGERGEEYQKASSRDCS